MKFNINDSVKVRLTDHGRRVREANFLPLVKDYGCTYFPMKEVDGWSTWQLWTLMREFGDETYLGGQMCFETEIEFMQ
jgi:hypothetical protein